MLRILELQSAIQKRSTQKVSPRIILYNTLIFLLIPLSSLLSKNLRLQLFFTCSCCNRIAFSFSALTCSISLFNLAKFPSAILVGLPLCESVPVFRVSESSSAGSAGAAMEGPAERFVVTRTHLGDGS
jgi:hypothetical protein